MNRDWSDRKPYTYLIGWSILNKWYYGVRYAKGCRPDDLWRTYFTSSEIVKNFQRKYGHPDVIQVRKVFDNPKSAKKWEHKVMVRFDMAGDKRFLNVRNVTGDIEIISGPNKGSFKKGQKSLWKGLNWKSILSEEEYNKRFYNRYVPTEKQNQENRERSKRLYEERTELRNLHRELHKMQFDDPIKKERHRIAQVRTQQGFVWITNGVDTKRIKIVDMNKYPDYYKGRTHNQEVLDAAKVKRSETRKRNKQQKENYGLRT